MSGNSFIKAIVISQKGTCASGHKTGDTFLIEDKTPYGLCTWAFYTLFPFAVALKYGGNFPWEEGTGKASVACPDPANPVVFELQRLNE